MKRLYFTLIAASVAARFAWVFARSPIVLHDAPYRDLARALAEGRGYADAYWMPGWPFWMSFFHGDFAVTIANAFLGVVTIVVTFFLARETNTNPWRAAAVCALVPSLVLLPRLLLSENLAVPLFAIATVALVRAARTKDLRAWIAFAIASAIATYVREACIVLVLAGIAVAIVPRECRDARAAGVALIVFAIALAPWVLHTRAITGRAVLTTSSQTNACIGLGEGATGGYRIVETQKDFSCARDGLAHHPFEVVTLAPAKLSRLFFYDDWIVDDFLEHVPGRTAMRVVCNIFWWFLCGFSIVAWRANKLLLAPIAAVALSAVVTFGVARFHAPLIPLLAVLASGYRRRS